MDPSIDKIKTEIPKQVRDDPEQEHQNRSANRITLGQAHSDKLSGQALRDDRKGGDPWTILFLTLRHSDKVPRQNLFVIFFTDR